MAFLVFISLMFFCPIYSIQRVPSGVTTIFPQKSKSLKEMSWVSGPCDGINSKPSLSIQGQQHPIGEPKNFIDGPVSTPGQSGTNSSDAFKTLEALIDNLTEMNNRISKKERIDLELGNSNFYSIKDSNVHVTKDEMEINRNSQSKMSDEPASKKKANPIKETFSTRSNKNSNNSEKSKIIKRFNKCTMAYCDEPLGNERTFCKACQVHYGIERQNKLNYKFQKSLKHESKSPKCLDNLCEQSLRDDGDYYFCKDCGKSYKKETFPKPKKNKSKAPKRRKRKRN